ncbi:hypothetical protein F7725_010748, partial [Dissostichus mawsoni]
MKVRRDSVQIDRTSVETLSHLLRHISPENSPKPTFSQSNRSIASSSIDLLSLTRVKGGPAPDPRNVVLFVGLLGEEGRVKTGCSPTNLHCEAAMNVMEARGQTSRKNPGICSKSRLSTHLQMLEHRGERTGRESSSSRRSGSPPGILQQSSPDPQASCPQTLTGPRPGPPERHRSMEPYIPLLHTPERGGST